MKIAKEKAPDNRGFFLYNGIANRELFTLLKIHC